MPQYTFTMSKYDADANLYGESYCPYGAAENRTVEADDEAEAHTLAVESCMFVFEDAGIEVKARGDGFVVLDDNGEVAEDYRVRVKEVETEE